MRNVVNMRRSSVHTWMFLHAAAFGFHPYTNEPWHWEFNPPGFKERFDARATMHWLRDQLSSLL